MRTRCVQSRPQLVHVALLDVHIREQSHLGQELAWNRAERRLLAPIASVFQHCIRHGNDQHHLQLAGEPPQWSDGFNSTDAYINPTTNYGFIITQPYYMYWSITNYGFIIYTQVHNRYKSHNTRT